MASRTSPGARARLLARPGAVGNERRDAPLEPGTHPLGAADARDGLLFVPSRSPPGDAWPLVVLLHGAGADAADILPVLAPAADHHGVLVLAPDSRGATWDLLTGGVGPDARFIDAALELVLQRAAVDPAHVALSGFSDGASYALSLGLANGDLFTHILAFSPGFAAPPARHGRPRIFVTHGRYDRVLPIDRCSRRIVPALRAEGYAVEYTEFDGGHIVPPELAEGAVTWMLRAAGAEER
ncbi:MAG TPA: hypothetical protein VFS05_11520 [Gemmatimonadaceae bacterium]|nr:hypothetical protein [Gemmatimonadaceae bacterium]